MLTKLVYPFCKHKFLHIKQTKVVARQWMQDCCFDKKWKAYNSTDLTSLTGFLNLKKLSLCDIIM